MHRLKVIHHLRTAAFLLVTVVIVGSIGVLVWANHIGMPQSWREAVERGIAKHDIHVKIGSLSYQPFRGIVAKEVSVFSDASRKRVISRLEGVVLDLDNAKLAKGQFQLSQVKLNNAKLTLPVHPDRADSEVIEITGIEGTFIPPGNRNIEIRNARGTIAGIDVLLNVKIADDLIGPRKPRAELTNDSHRELASKIIRELRNWSYDADSPPQIQILIDGKRSEPEEIKAEIGFHATNIEKNQHRLKRIDAQARLHRNLLTVTSLEAGDEHRKLSAHLDYELGSQSGRFDLQSNLEIPQLLQSWFGMNPAADVVIAGDQNIQAAGEFTLREGMSPDIHVTGNALCRAAMLRGIRFDQIESSFAWLNGDLYLRDLLLQRPDGKVTGKALIQGPIVRMDLESSLLPHYYLPLFRGEPMEELINDFTSREESRLDLHLEGGFDLNDPLSWAYAGEATMDNVQFKGVDLAHVSSRLSLSSDQMEFTKGTVTFDYSNYAMRKRFEGAERGQLEFDRVHYQRNGDRKVVFSGVEGTFWPAPLCRLFLNETADHLESYQFHQPPQIAGGGTIGLSNASDTLIQLQFQSSHAADYLFLGSTVTIGTPAAKVTITDDETTLDDFTFKAFSGEARADMRFPRNQPMVVSTDYSQLSLDGISACYDLKMKCGGLLTGKLKFEVMPARIETMQGEGSFSLANAELFSVPIFGPLSSLMQAVLNDKRAGAEQARNATCTYSIKNGIIITDDFNTATTSLVFAGVGSVDLTKMTMDLTMRVNARGLLGLIFLPLKPFAGMFQFQGTGPLSDTTWRRVSFTNPDEKIKKLLEAPRVQPGNGG